MKHQVIPFERQDNPGIDRNDPVAAATAIELKFPETFSRKAWRVIHYMEGAMYLYSYKGKFVATDESLELTIFGDGSREAPFGAPRFVCDSLKELETELEKLADFYDEAGDIPGWDKTPEGHGKVRSGETLKSVLVTMRPEKQFIAFLTYDRQHGMNGRFIIGRDHLYELVNGSISTVRYDGDIGNYVKITRLNEALYLVFLWLHHYDDGTINGFMQEVEIPISKVQKVLGTDCSEKHIHVPKSSSAEIIHAPAAATIRKVKGNKLVRHAFLKAMRDLFRWRGDQITLYPDGGYNFYFTTRSGYPKCGGLILHESESCGHPQVFYSIHT